MLSGNGNSKVSPTDGLTWVGARDTCVSKKQVEDKTGLWRGVEVSMEALLGFPRLKCVKYVAPYPNVFSHILLNTICISRLSLKVSTQNQKLFEMCFVFANLDWKHTF